MTDGDPYQEPPEKPREKYAFETRTDRPQGQSRGSVKQAVEQTSGFTEDEQVEIAGASSDVVAKPLSTTRIKDTGAPGAWLSSQVAAFLVAEDAPNNKPEESLVEGSEGTDGFTELLSDLRVLKSRVNWVSVEGKSQRRPKEAVVIGTPSMIKRDYVTISQAYATMGLQVERASQLSAAVARGRMDGNLRSVRGRDWGVVLCLSLDTSKCLSESDFNRLELEKREFSRVNRLANLKQVLWSKDDYCSTVQASGEWLAAYTFPCWVLPRDDDSLLNTIHHENAGDITWIVKPYKQGGGKGIFVLDTVGEIERLVSQERKVVLQPYLNTPHLLDGRKWDLRTYVLVTSATPVVRAYVFRDGLVRLATEAYNPNAKHGGNRTQFLTNTSVNKKKVKDMSQLTRSFAALEKDVGSEHFRLLFSRIRRAIGMLLVTSEVAFARRFATISPTFRCANCYHLLGVDLIVDTSLVPRVIEVNGEPSMQLSGASQSHYDTTKNMMQQEVARIVLQPLPSVAGKLVRDMRKSGVGASQIEWLSRNEEALTYLLHLRREAQSLSLFTHVYPDTFSCENIGRKRLWGAFLRSLEEKGNLAVPWRMAHPDA